MNIFKDLDNKIIPGLERLEFEAYRKEQENISELEKKDKVTVNLDIKDEFYSVLEENAKEYETTVEFLLESIISKLALTLEFKDQMERTDLRLPILTQEMIEIGLEDILEKSKEFNNGNNDFLLVLKDKDENTDDKYKTVVLVTGSDNIDNISNISKGVK